MINVNNRFSQNSIQNSGAIKNRTEEAPAKASVSNEQSPAGIRISSLSQQLSEAQAHADSRDSSLDREVLSAKASSITSQFFGKTYQQNQLRYDAEVPNTNDATHIERAKQATAFMNGGGTNPFKGLAYDQLSLIVYDESGTFTMNERRAAFSEQGDQRFAWECQVCAEINRQWDEKHGDISDALKDIMDYFDNLPPIEESRYDSSWRQSLQNNIAHFSAGSSMSSGNKDNLIGSLN